MNGFLPLGGLAINLDRVEAIRLDQPRDRGPGKCHRIVFLVGASRYEDRSLSLDEDSDEGIALRRWASGIDAPALPPIPAFEGRPVVQPLRCCHVGSEIEAIAEGKQHNHDSRPDLFTPPVAEAACNVGGDVA